MKNIILSKQAKATVDILLVLVLIVTCVFSDIEKGSTSYWKSAHCILGSLWMGLIILHVVQHWRLIKSFVKKKVILRNKITALTILSFILMFLSITSFIIGFNVPFLKFHHFIGHLFFLVIIIHTIDKFKRFLAFFKSKQ